MNLEEATMKVLEEFDNKKHLNKSEAKQVARELLQNVVGTAYYRLENYENEYDEETIQLINHYLDMMATRALKAVGLDYITY